MKVAIIGGGVSGLVAIKECVAAGLVPICFEAEDDIGGQWRFNEKCGHSSVYRSIIMNTSRDMSSFSDFPIPLSEALYMTHDRVLQYFRDYVQQFNLLQYINFNSLVIKVEQLDGNKWEVKYRQDNQEKMLLFDAVIVSTGILSIPSYPSFQGEESFHGSIMHSHMYKDFDAFSNKRVLVVGMGNSAADIAVELSRHASQVFMSTRSGSWMIGRTGLYGKPIDFSINQFSSVWLPSWLREILFGIASSLQWGDLKNYGIMPNKSLAKSHIILNTELLGRIGCNAIRVKSNIARLKEDTVEFADGSIEKVDAIIYATGYEIRFPFLGGKYAENAEHEADLYKCMIDPERKNLIFIGTLQIGGSHFPVAEMQARVAAQILAQNIAYPSKEKMLHEIKKEKAERLQTYGESPRLPTQRDYVSYMNDLSAFLDATPTLWKLLKLALHDRKLAWTCFFGPAYPFQFRLFGKGKWEGAAHAIREASSRSFEFAQARQLEHKSMDPPPRHHTRYVLPLLLSASVIFYVRYRCRR